jgi:hypothetical protein
MLVGMAKKLPFTESLREAVRNAPVSRYKMAKDTGISQGNLSHFVHGARGLSMHNLDVLCEYLGLSLVQTKEKGR